MGRGAQKELQAQERQSYDLTNQMLQQQQQQQQQARSYLLPQYQKFVESPGYSAEEKAAISGGSMGALGSAFGSAVDAGTRQAARTRNWAGIGEATSELGREKMRQASDVAQKNELAFGERKRADVLTGLEGMGGLYGMDAATLQRLYGIPAELINAGANNNRPSGFLNSLLGTLGGVGSAAIGKW